MSTEQATSSVTEEESKIEKPTGNPFGLAPGSQPRVVYVVDNEEERGGSFSWVSILLSGAGLALTAYCLYKGANQLVNDVKGFFGSESSLLDVSKMEELASQIQSSV
jgi:hypothetical protein